MSAPELAVVVLSVGAPPELGAAVASLLAQPEPLEIVVVNSGGGDPAAVLPAAPGVTVISLAERLWPGAARNVGIRATRAPWVSFLASDLVAAPGWAAGRLARHRTGQRSVASALDAGPNPNLFEWAAHLALHAGRMPGLPRRRTQRYGASYDRTLFDQYGLFREDLRIGEDTEFHRRLRRSDRPVWAPAVVASHRYPASWRALIEDQRARGERAADHWRPTPGGALVRMVNRFGTAATLGWRATRDAPRDRWRTLAALPLLAAASFTYERGVARGLRTGQGGPRPPTDIIAVAILDRDDWAANTDVIVLVDPVLRQLTWVPRDLWVPSLRDRINAAYRFGDGRRFLDALAELRLHADGLLCLRRAATEAALAGADVTVPVSEPMDFYYPLTPLRPIEEGRKQVSFRPPSERLTGERLHQWLGARTRVTGAGSDLQRIERQQVFIRVLLETSFDFSQLLADPGLVRTHGVDPLPVLRRVRPDWHCCLFDSVTDTVIDGKAVLLRK